MLDGFIVFGAFSLRNSACARFAGTEVVSPEKQPEVHASVSWENHVVKL
jgi:hypothetical protein